MSLQIPIVAIEELSLNQKYELLMEILKNRKSGQIYSAPSIEDEVYELLLKQIKYHLNPPQYVVSEP